MKALRLYGLLNLGFCSWILLFPPWVDCYDAEYSQLPFSDPSWHPIGHHWRFSPLMHWGWDWQTSTSVYVEDLTARIDYQLMAYEVVLALIASGFAFLLMRELWSPLRKLLVCGKVEVSILRMRLRSLLRCAPRTREQSQPEPPIPQDASSSTVSPNAKPPDSVRSMSLNEALKLDPKTNWKAQPR